VCIRGVLPTVLGPPSYHNILDIYHHLHPSTTSFPVDTPPAPWLSLFLRTRPLLPSVTGLLAKLLDLRPRIALSRSVVRASVRLNLNTVPTVVTVLLHLRSRHQSLRVTALRSTLTRLLLRQALLALRRSSRVFLLGALTPFRVKRHLLILPLAALPCRTVVPTTA
jgi:hypothetical protein